MAGWGNAIGRIFDWVPGRAEYRRNKIKQLKEEIRVLQQKKARNVSDYAKYERLVDQLSKLESEATNAG